MSVACAFQVPDALLPEDVLAQLVAERQPRFLADAAADAANASASTTALDAGTGIVSRAPAVSIPAGIDPAPRPLNPHITTPP
jgi:hypothetical protein